MSSLRYRAIEGVRIGDEFTITRTFTEEDVLQFGDVSRDYNPVHYDGRFAEARGVPGKICHGLLVASLITEIGGQLGLLAVRMDLTFKRPVYMGDTVRCTLTITDMDETGLAEVRATCRNQAGVTVLEASLTGVVPQEEQREILGVMVEEGDATNKLAGREPLPRGIAIGGDGQQEEADHGT